MYRSLYFKIILIMVVFIIAVMCVVGTILLNSIMNYYNSFCFWGYCFFNFIFIYIHRIRTNVNKH